MNIFKKTFLMSLVAFAPMSTCFIEGEGSGDTGGSSSADGDQGGGNADGGEKLTTSQQLEKEFGQEITPATDNDDSDSSTGEDEESAKGGEDDETDTDGDEEGDNADDNEEGEDKVEEPAEKPKGRAQQRIDELTAKQREAERDRDYWRKRAEELGDGPKDAVGEVVHPEEPDPSKYQYGEADLDYIKDLAKFEATTEIMGKQAEARFKSEAAALEAKWTGNLAQKLDKFPDYEEKVIQAAKDGKWKCGPVLALGIKDSEYGVDISYELASNPAEAERLSSLTPLEQAREFGRMEVEQKYKANPPKPAEAENVTPKKVVTKAPPPPKRQVRGGGGKFDAPADTDDFAAFERMADAKMKKSG